ncbi:MAG: DNA repair protein RecO [Planctomycetales bacterium]|nr:DNA repair protein RecO [Planctomycetales bacterium]
MSAEKTLAIVLRVVEFSETSYIATLYTEDFGKITGLAKGARRPKSAFENALDVLAVSRVVFLRKSTDGIDLLTEAKLERRFRAAARSLRSLYSAYYVVELLNSLTDEHDPHPELFRMAVRTVMDLDENRNPRESLLRFELAVLRSLGQMPLLDRCVECGTLLPEGVRVAFGHLAGGALCPRCKVGQRHVVSLSAGGVKLLRTLADEIDDIEEQPLVMQRGQFEERCGNGTDQDAVSVAAPIVNAWGELRGLMDNRMSHALGRRARMFAYLKALK